MQAPLDLGHELVVDLFAGGGGASEGIRQALGRDPDVAVNHDPEAVAMHTANHPGTAHYCESVFTVDPVRVTRNQPVGLLWASPDCKHFSKAKGGRPVSKKIRGLAWVVVRWARAVRPRVIALENVEEFQDWGPIGRDGRPCSRRKGQTFQQFVQALQRQGYKVDWRQLRACDYGAPTIRKRLFMIARRDGLPIVWPSPTHGHQDSPAVKRGKLQPWRTAAECIDWSIPCPSIFERKKPLAEATLRRIAKGVQRFVIDAEEPFIVTCNHGGEGFRGQSANDPMLTLTAARDAHGLVTPYLARIGQTGGNGNYVNDAQDPLTTITSKAEHLLVSPTLIQAGYGERPGQAPRVPGLNKPLGTVVGGGIKHALVAATLAGVGGRAGQSRPRGLDEPMATVTAKADTVVAAAHLTKFQQNSTGQDLAEPVDTVMAGAQRFGVVAAFMAQHNTGVVGHEMRSPVSTLTSSGSHQQLVASNLVKLRGTCQDGQDVRQPAPTVTAGGTHVGEVRAFLTRYNGTNIGQGVAEPMGTLTAKPRFGLVTVAGELYQIADIGMRMLEPRELYRAQGFPDSYIIDLEFNGRRLPKSSQVRMCGNSVCPPLAAALVAANFKHEQKFQRAA